MESEKLCCGNLLVMLSLVCALIANEDFGRGTGTVGVDKLGVDKLGVDQVGCYPNERPVLRLLMMY